MFLDIGQRNYLAHLRSANVYSLQASTRCMAAKQHNLLRKSKLTIYMCVYNTYLYLYLLLTIGCTTVAKARNAFKH